MKLSFIKMVTILLHKEKHRRFPIDPIYQKLEPVVFVFLLRACICFGSKRGKTL